MEIKERIKKDIEAFDKNIDEMQKAKISAGAEKIVEMALMYRKDAQSYLEKEDLYTSFSCISYAHGLLDAVRGVYGKIQ
ncbi:MAG: DUF357 domain-containing protein [Candidatus Micrarchaeaceae archaeon]